MQPDEPTEEERQEELPQDGQTPFTPADLPSENSDHGVESDSQNLTTQDDTHPVTDTNVDTHQQYDEGVMNAAEANEPNADNAVTDYKEPEKEDNNN